MYQHLIRMCLCFFFRLFLDILEIDQFPIMFNTYFVYLSAIFLSMGPSGVFFQGLDILHPIFQFTLRRNCHSRYCVTSRVSLSPFFIDFFTNCCSLTSYKPQYKVSFLFLGNSRIEMYGQPYKRGLTTFPSNATETWHFLVNSE